MKTYTLEVSNTQSLQIQVTIDETQRNIDNLIDELICERGLNWYHFEKYTEPEVDIQVIDIQDSENTEEDLSETDEYFE